MKEKDPHEGVKLYGKNVKHVQKMLDTTELHHRQAYNKAVMEVLMDEDGKVDYKRLKDNPENQEKFADAMADFYVEKVEDALGIKIKKKDKKEEDFAKDMLMKTYHGITRAELKKHTGTYEDKFTFDNFSNIKDQYMKDIQENLAASAGQHLTKKDISNIIKYTKAEHLLDEKYIEDVQKIAPLVQIFEDSGQIREGDLDELVRRGAIPKTALKKKKKKEESEENKAA